ncbi:colicin V biosynthesis protein [Companilactobacillus sp. RD055328]|uniref:CvpA family protein n=1 Tax=Companilactobacillus sp. RD055328 TaxID=2916634 RepID=UPI001FC807E2|nr:CvpA family protein [Companilactobacillus sp. RD055328]GKQ42097.1 colicin V biosynthesis protein [Companilactobacillus sp. RD055328]
MLSFIIILILSYGVYIGVRRGLAMQIFYSAGYLIFFALAALLYRVLEPQFELIVPYPSASLDSKFAFFSTELGLSFDKAFYYAFAFVFICFIGWIIVRFGGLYMKKLTYYPMDEKMSKIGGGLLAFFTNYVGLFMILYLMAMVPVPALQDSLSHSFMTTLIVRYTPLLTNLFTAMWINIV